MSNRQNDGSHHMDRDALRLFNRGLFLMLTGVLLSVLALVFLPHLAMPGRVALVLGGIAVAVVLVVWPPGRGMVRSEAGREPVVGE